MRAVVWTARKMSHDLATHMMPLADAPTAYEDFQKKRNGTVKVVLKPYSTGGAIKQSKLQPDERSAIFLMVEGAAAVGRWRLHHPGRPPLTVPCGREEPFVSTSEFLITLAYRDGSIRMGCAGG